MPRRAACTRSGRNRLAAAVLQGQNVSRAVDVAEESQKAGEARQQKGEGLVNAEPANGTFERLWVDTVHGHPADEFIAFADSSGRTRTWTYGEFDQLVGRFAGSLAARGLA